MTMQPREPSSDSVELLYKSMGFTSNIIAQIIAGKLVRVVWKYATPGPNTDPPHPLDAKYPMREVLVAATLHGVAFSLVKAVTERGGARLFQRVTGEWPGDRGPGRPR